jgi:hypothetical protein
MIKLGVAILGLMTIPLFLWLMVPALIVIAALSPFLLGLAVFMVACTRPRSAVKASATAAKPVLPQPELAAHTG